MGFPPQFFTVLFAIPRVTGYLAHWRESLVDPDTKIIRPQQDYQVCLSCLAICSVHLQPASAAEALPREQDYQHACCLCMIGCSTASAKHPVTVSCKAFCSRSRNCSCSSIWLGRTLCLSASCQHSS